MCLYLMQCFQEPCECTVMRTRICADMISLTRLRNPSSTVEPTCGQENVAMIQVMSYPSFCALSANRYNECSRVHQDDHYIFESDASKMFPHTKSSMFIEKCWGPNASFPWQLCNSGDRMGKWHTSIDHVGFCNWGMGYGEDAEWKWRHLDPYSDKALSKCLWDNPLPGYESRKRWNGVFPGPIDVFPTARQDKAVAHLAKKMGLEKEDVYRGLEDGDYVWTTPPSGEYDSDVDDDQMEDFEPEEDNGENDRKDQLVLLSSELCQVIDKLNF